MSRAALLAIGAAAASALTLGCSDSIAQAAADGSPDGEYLPLNDAAPSAQDASDAADASDASDARDASDADGHFTVGDADGGPPFDGNNDGSPPMIDAAYGGPPPDASHD